MNQKMNSSHWDVATDFTGCQAAALALGLDPIETETKYSISLPLYIRMKRCYISKRDWLRDDMSPHNEEGVISRSDMLESVELHWWRRQVEPGTWGSYCDWVKAETESRFEHQRFTRQELTRWLVEIKFESRYKFDIDNSDAVRTIAGNGGGGTIKRWTPERKQKLAEHRAKHGIKAAATEFNISESRIRQLLPREKPPAKPFSGFPQRKY
jgi:hypothetical protein